MIALADQSVDGGEVEPIAALADLRSQPGADALALAQQAGIEVLAGYAVASVFGRI